MSKNSFVRFVILWGVSFACALIVAWPSLRYPWYWDDYHLIRVFTGEELASVFRGPWDVDNIESVSYRPLWVVANHLRAWLFGENIVLQRLFLLAVLALFTALVALAAHMLGLLLPYAAGAAAFSLLPKSNHANLMWLTDATHALSGIPVALCALLPAATQGKARYLWPVAGFLLALTGLSVREDIAALFPFVVLVQAVRAAQADRDMPRAPRLRVLARWALLVFRATAPLLAALLVYFAARKAYVDGAVTGFNFAGFVAHVRMTFLIMGMRAWRTTLIAWCVFAALLLGAALIGRGRIAAMRWQVAAWLVCALVGCVPGLVTERSNLLMVPTVLFALALAAALQALARSGAHKAVPVLAVLASLTFGVITFRQTRRALLAGHPESTDTITYAGDFLYGPYARRATIPPERRASGEVYLRQFGIESRDTYKRALRDVIKAASKRPKRPQADGKPFRPPNPFLVH